MTMPEVILKIWHELLGLIMFILFLILIGAISFNHKDNNSDNDD